MNILTVATDFLPKLGGISNHIHNLSRQLVQLGQNARVLHIVENAGSNRLELTKGEYDVYRLFITDDLSKLRKLKYRRILAEIIDREIGNVDVVHSHELFVTEHLLNPGDYRWVWTNHTSGFFAMLDRRDPIGFLKKRIERATLARADAIICVSDTVRQATEKFLPRQENMYTVGNGVDVERFDNGRTTDRGILRAQFGLHPHNVVALIPGRWMPVKGTHVLADAIEHYATLYRSAYQSTQFVFAGSGLGDQAYRQSVRSRLAKHSNCRFIERIAYEDMPALYAAVDFVVLPSLFETAGIVALEAMAAGKPIVASDVGGLREIVTEPNRGLGVPPNDPMRLGRALYRMRIQSGSVEFSDITEKNRRWVRETHDWPSIANQILNVYRSVVHENPDHQLAVSS